MIALTHHLIPAAVFTAYALGVVSAVNALLSARSSQSAIAWSMACVMFPYLAVPMYWLFGRNRLQGYVLARRSSGVQVRRLVKHLRDYAPPLDGLPKSLQTSCRVFERLADMPFTRGNRVALMHDGEFSFETIFERIAQARDYVLVQFYIVRDDSLGQRMARLLKEKVAEGVRVYFLFDQLGSYGLASQYVRDLRRAGVEMHPFRAGRGWMNRFQINFRNHRKLVVTDGRWAVMGGANLGDEYRGRGKLGYWCDTMISVEGPVVQEMQLSFAEDWLFLVGRIPDLNWAPNEPADDGRSALVMPTGPAGELGTCSMMFSQAINSAEKRLWIASPYFVPDEQNVRALQLAALRGVDVRILIPEKTDSLLVHWASFTFLEELERTGVRFYRYTGGMFHEKVVLVDDRLALVGSANTDNRSFYLNFELTLLVADPGFADETEAMLKKDFENSHEADRDELERRGILFRIAARLSRLLAPSL